MTHDVNDILAALGQDSSGSAKIAENNNHLVDQALAGIEPVKTIEEIQAEEKEIERLEALREVEIKTEWFTATAPKPFVAAKWNGTHWIVEVYSGTGSELLDPRKRNLLQLALKIALVRHERSVLRQLRSRNRKSENQKQQEIAAALAASAAANLLT